MYFPPTANVPQNPCNPSPCGPNSQCRVSADQPICTCLPEYTGVPPSCRPECVSSAECPSNRACINQKCADPCPGICGLSARCETRNHSPICSCPPNQTGDPFVKCFNMPAQPKEPINACVPSPCGPFAVCQDNAGYPACSCVENYIGTPPNCRPECTINSECGQNQACIREKCRDPCPGSCGSSAVCDVFNHTPVCNCPDKYTGDPFSSCFPKPPPREIIDLNWNLGQCVLSQCLINSPSFLAQPAPKNSCEPSPCGPNTQCRDGVCTCLPEYRGDPYFGCQPECVQNSDCPLNRACSNNKCVDPCPNICGRNAECNVVNHIPMCSCIADYQGDPFSSCQPIARKKPLNQVVFT